MEVQKMVFLSGVMMLLVAPLAKASLIPNSCLGNCGVDTANGSVPNPPSGNTSYMYVSTNGGAANGGTIPVGAIGSETNGSTLTSAVFTATPGELLSFNFFYITSDGSGYPDYAWSGLMNASDGSESALLFTAETEPPPASIVPGLQLPPTAATLNPSSVPIMPGTTWDQLGSWSGQCFLGVGEGCGNSGWVASTYVIPAAGNYYFAFGTTNTNDTIYDSGLAIDNLTAGGGVIGFGTPEPSTIYLLFPGIALIILCGYRQRRAWFDRARS